MDWTAAVTVEETRRARQENYRERIELTGDVDGLLALEREWRR